MHAKGQELAFGLVQVTRDFLEAHRMLRRVGQRHRAGELTFTEIQELVGDGEESVLFRLKECSHALFRGPGGSSEEGRIGAEELFDLAVGSLFHEAMKFRENFYQRDVYGPKVRSLRDACVPDARGLLQEFERILAGADERLEESLAESEALVAEMLRPFGALLRAHAGNGLLTRFLGQQASLVEEVFGESIDDVLALVHGSAGRGWARAARSYLESGFFAQAVPALDLAIAHGEPAAGMQRLRSYALGMQAYLDGRYPQSLDELSAWVDAGPSGEDPQLAELALSVLTRVGQLVEQEAAGEIARRATALAGRIHAWAGEPEAPRATASPGERP
jgi:hypothetical protein